MKKLYYRFMIWFWKWRGRHWYWKIANMTIDCGWKLAQYINPTYGIWQDKMNECVENAKSYEAKL